MKRTFKHFIDGVWAAGPSYTEELSMKTLYGMELYKLWSRKGFLVLVALIFAANLSLFAYAQQQGEIPIGAYGKLQDKLLSLPNEKRYDYICEYDDQIQKHSALQKLLYLNGREDQGSRYQTELLRAQYPDLEETTSAAFLENSTYYTGSLEQESVFMKDIRQEMETLHGYRENLQQIQRKADQIASISIFADPSSFSSMNIRKTAEDFRDMQDVVITYQLEKGLREALHFPFTDILAVLMTGMIAAAMILEEKEKHLFAFVKPSINGGFKTIRIKFLVMVLSALAPILLLYAGNLLYMHMVCGLGDLQASLQSLAQYAQSTLHITTGGYLVLFLVTKWAAAGIIGAVMMLISIFTKQRIHCFGGMLLLLGTEFLCYRYLPNHHAISILRYLNLISFLRTDVFYENYYNLNLLNQAYSLQKLALVTMAVLFLVLFACINAAYVKGQITVRYSASRRWIFPFLYKIRDAIRGEKRSHIPSALWLQECYKLFWVQKGIVIILLFLGVQMYIWQHNSIYVSLEESGYMQYMDIMQGKPSDKTDLFISSQQKHYEELHMQQEKYLQSLRAGIISEAQYDQMMNILDTQLYSETMFQKVEQQYAYVKEGRNREMLTAFGYERLLFEEDISLIPAVLSMLCIILLLSNLLCAEYTNRADRLLFTCSKGGKPLLRCKLRIAIGCGLLLTAASYVPDTVRIVKSYGCQGLFASVTSLQELSAMPSAMNIITFLLIGFVLKLMAVISTIFLLFLLSEWLRHQAQVLFLLLMITQVPVALHIMGAAFLDSVSLYPLLCSSILLKNGQWLQVVLSAVGYAGLCGWCYHKTVCHK